MIRRLPVRQKNSLVHRERDHGLLNKLAALLLCGLVLASGFLYAARQHFAALEFGYQSEGLRRERQKLLEDQRRLLLEREEAASPGRLERAARRIGMQQVQPAQIGTPKEKKPLVEQSSPVAGPATINSSAPAANSAGTY
jgi:cell division protein FtsL